MCAKPTLFCKRHILPFKKEPSLFHSLTHSPSLFQSLTLSNTLSSPSLPRCPTNSTSFKIGIIEICSKVSYRQVFFGCFLYVMLKKPTSFFGADMVWKKRENHPSARYPEDIQRNTDYWEEALSHVHQYLLSLKSGCVLY